MTTHSALAAPAPIASAEPLLRAEGLQISVGSGEGRRMLVPGIDLTVHRGETVGIVGESGSGKSLTARALIGLPPRGVDVTGSVRYGGRELIGQSEGTWRSMRGSQIGMVLQDPFTSLNPLRTCGGHLTEMLRDARGRRLSRPAARSEAERRLAEVGITDPAVVDRYPFELSGGMRQRVAIAASLARNPDLLIADEPSTALDTVVQAEILELLAEMQRRRTMSLILITHDLRVAFSLCNRVYVLYAGQVAEVGPAAQLARHPLHPYTHALLGADPPLTERVDRLVNIPGRVPPADTVLDRCPFVDRCRWATDVCRQPVALAEFEPLRWSACIRLPEIRDQLAEPATTYDAPPSDGEQGALAASEAPGAPDPAGRKPGSPLLTITGLSRHFPLARNRVAVALGGVDLTVDAGESVGLVGASGSGKTTLSRIVVGLDTATGGTVQIGGIDAADYRRLNVADLVTVRRTVQYIFQDPYSSLNPSLTIGSALAEALTLRHGRRAATSSRVEALLAQVGLPGRYRTLKPVALSGGERQRIAIARTLAIEPALLVCDEPVSALDVSVQAHILNLLRDLHDSTGVAFLFITHDLAVVRQMADRLYVLNKGLVVEQGATADVLDNPSHEYTRTLLAAVPGSTHAAPNQSASR